MGLFFERRLREDVLMCALRLLPLCAGVMKYEKGIWWMPWRIEAMKDVLGCEKLGGAAKRL